MYLAPPKATEPAVSAALEAGYRHIDTAAAYNNAPLRTAIYEDTLGRAHLSINQPSSKFASFGDTRIDHVGAGRQSRPLLRLISLPVPPELDAV